MATQFKGLSGLGLGVVSGIGLMFLMDPDLGRRRRAEFRGRALHLSHTSRCYAGKVARDLTHRARGLLHDARGLVEGREPADDDVLTERVRSRLGRSASHPRLVEVSTKQGVVTLAGLMTKRDLSNVIRSARRVPGVRAVQSRVSMIEQAQDSRHAGATSSLPVPSQFALRRNHWPPATRAVVSVIGGVLILREFRRGFLAGCVAGSIGVALIGRAALNRPLLPWIEGRTRSQAA